MSQHPSTEPADMDKAQIAKRLFSEIQAAVKEGNIARAEDLRDKLLTANPMALGEIIKSAELIEEVKTAKIDKNHLAIWDKLYGPLSPEEKNCLYYSLKKVTIPPKKVILAQGAFNTRLFFIDNGQVTISLPKGDKHIVLAQLGRGDILGEYTFTTISLCSATAVSQTEVQLMYLDSAAADGWENKQPGLLDKLVDFCIQYGRVDDIIKRKKLEKRTAIRYSIEGRITATLLTREGKKTETYFRGVLSDLSTTGTCFSIKCSNKTTARALLARHLFLSFSFERGDKKLTFSAVGKVVGVSFYLYNDYSVHMRFIKQLKEELIQKATFQGI
jgi:CRP-like cAMP-binding protein